VNVFEEFGKLVIAHHDVEDSVSNIGRSLDYIGSIIQTKSSENFVKNISKEDTLQEMEVYLLELSGNVNKYKNIIDNMLKEVEEEKDD
jgi:hypothetical protein